MRIHKRRYVIVTVMLTAIGVLGWIGWKASARPALAEYRTISVSRANVEVALVAPGTVEAVNRTEMRCELEELPVDGVFGHGINILELTPEGTPLKKGDIICRFDDSKYQELVRRQKIKVMRDEADFQGIILERDAAAVALRAYKEGEAKFLIEDLQGQTALLESDLQRARERLAWSQHLATIGYGTLTQVASDKSTLMRLENQLQNTNTTLTNFQRYTYPRALRQLEIQVEIKDVNRIYQELKLKISRDRLAHYQELIDKSILRAPHDGVLIYATMLYGDAPKLTEGGHVHQGMRMFYLPDLSRLITQVRLHETVASHVRVGMPAVVRLEAFPDQPIQGRVLSIDPVPAGSQTSGFLDVRQFRAQVELIDPPSGTLPDMTAEARIVTNQQDDSLVVPSEALAIEDGWPYCYVLGSEGLERRPVSLEPGDEEYLRVISGLSEGEQVVLDPAPLQDHPDTALDPMHEAPPAPDTTSDKSTPPPEHSALTALPARG